MRKFATLAAMTALLVVAGAGFLQAKTFVIPHIVEASGPISTTNYTFDTLINLVYIGGLTGAAGSGASTVTAELYLFDNSTGNFLTGDGTPTGPVVCNPCTRTLSGTLRKDRFNVDLLVTAVTPGWTGGRNGFGVIVAEGDTDNLSIQGFVTNRHTSPQHVSVFGFAPVEIPAAAN